MLNYGEIIENIYNQLKLEIEVNSEIKKYILENILETLKGERIMKCPVCKGKTDSNAKFCDVCGANITITQELINRGIAGDQSALTDLFERTFDDVYSTVFFTIKGNKDASLDIVHETYIYNFRKLDTLKSAESFPAWIKTSARNRAFSYLRSQQKKLKRTEDSSYKDDQTPRELVDDRTEHIPDEYIEKQENNRLLWEILNSLPEEQYLVITMFYEQQLSIKEIAETLNVSENTVKSRLNYGKKKVEKKVLELEKNGTKIYGLAPIVFFMLLLKNFHITTASSVPLSMLPEIQAGVSASVSSVSTGVSGVANTAVKVGTGIASKTITKITAAVLAGVLLVSGGVIGSKYLFDNNSDIQSTTGANVTYTESSSEVETTTTKRIYNEVSADEEKYINTLLALTHDTLCDDYSNMKSKEIKSINNDFRRTLIYYEDCIKLFEPVKQDNTYQYYLQEDMNNAYGKMFGVDLDKVKLEDFEKDDKYYIYPLFSTGSPMTLKIHNTLYNEDKSQVTVYYMYNDGRPSTQIDYENEPMGSLSYNKAEFIRQDSEEYPFRLISNKKVDIKDYNYKGKTVDFGEYTLDVPDGWVYEKELYGSVNFYEPETHNKNNSGKLMGIIKIKSEGYDSNNMRPGQVLVDNGEDIYYQTQVTDVQAYRAQGETQPKREWKDKYDFQYYLMEKVCESFKLK